VVDEPLGMAERRPMDVESGRRSSNR